MTRLVVEEGGKRRAFKVGDGVITVGTGASATLKLASTKVAELHAEIIVQGGVVRIRPKAGVLPPTLKGRAQSAEFTVPAGATVVIGDAKLTVDPPDPAHAPAPPPPAKREEWERSSRELYKERGLKPQHILLIAAPIVIVVGLVINKFFTKAGPSPIAASAQLNRAADNIRNGMYDHALADLAQIEQPTPEIQAKIDELRATIEQRKKETADDAANQLGSLYLETKILKFESDRLKGKYEIAAVRVFVKRVDEFLRRWPAHPEADAVRRKRDRYAGDVDLKKPPTYAELEYEIELLTAGRKGNYAEAIKTLQAWIDTAQGDERAKGLTLLDKKIAAREANFHEVMLEARHQYQKGQIAQAVEWLVVLICNSGDQVMADKAAEELIKFDRLDEMLRGYRTGRPEQWPILSTNPVLVTWMKETKFS